MWKTSHITEKRPKHTFHLKRSLVSAVAVSQHACFYGFMPLSEFLSSCLLHHWAMRFSSQWNLILLLYAQECFSPLEWQGEFTFLLTVPKKHPSEASLFARCLDYKGAARHSTHCTKSPFLEVSVKSPRPSLPPGRRCNRSVQISARRASVKNCAKLCKTVQNTAALHLRFRRYSEMCGHIRTALTMTRAFCFLICNNINIDFIYLFIFK